MLRGFSSPRYYYYLSSKTNLISCPHLTGDRHRIRPPRFPALPRVTVADGVSYSRPTFRGHMLSFSRRLSAEAGGVLL